MLQSTLLIVSPRCLQYGHASLASSLRCVVRGYQPDASRFATAESARRRDRRHSIYQEPRRARTRQREAAIFREISSGNFPDFLRNFKAVEIRGDIRRGSSDTPRKVKALLHAMPDYLAVGSDADFVRMPMTSQTAQRIADEFGCVLPTRKMVDAIDRQAELHLPPHALTENRETVATFRRAPQTHRTAAIRKAARPAHGRHQKGYRSLTADLRAANRLAIYGWRQLDGRPIQPLTIVHSNRYVDYSHGVRLVLNAIVLDGELLRVTDLLADPARCAGQR